MNNADVDRLVYRLTGMDLDGGGLCVLSVDEIRSIIQIASRITRADCAELASCMDAPHVAAAICIDAAGGEPH